MLCITSGGVLGTTPTYDTTSTNLTPHNHNLQVLLGGRTHWESSTTVAGFFLAATNIVMTIVGYSLSLTKVKAGVSSRHLLNSDTLANTYRPRRARDIATMRRRTSLKWPTWRVRTSDNIT